MSPTGSLIYMAPELLEHCLGGRHTDWWALGVLSHELITGSSFHGIPTSKASFKGSRAGAVAYSHARIRAGEKGRK